MEFFEPRISSDTALYWEGCKEHRLIMRRCKKCGTTVWPASYVCPKCLSSEMEPEEVEPEGVLYSFVVMHKPFHMSLVDKVPYVVAAVDLNNRARISANILDCKVEDIRCGAKVSISFEDSETYSRPIAHIKEGE